MCLEIASSHDLEAMSHNSIYLEVAFRGNGAPLYLPVTDFIHQSPICHPCGIMEGKMASTYWIYPSFCYRPQQLWEVAYGVAWKWCHILLKLRFPQAPPPKFAEAILGILRGNSTLYKSTNTFHYLFTIHGFVVWHSNDVELLQGRVQV